MQTMAELKRLLSATNVMFTETRFESDVGIDVNPFTSVCSKNTDACILAS